MSLRTADAEAPRGLDGEPRQIGVAMAMDVGGILPVGLMGALEQQMRADLHAGVTFVGLAVATYFLSGGLVAVLAGPEVDRLGWRRSATIAVSASVAAMVALSLVGRPWEAFVALACAGVGQAVIVPATGMLLRSGLPADRVDRAICVKMAAVPTGLLIAGLAVPALGLTVGWRWCFVCAALVPLVGLALAPRESMQSATVPTVPRAAGRAAQRRLAKVGVAAFLASLVPGALTGFAIVALLRVDVSVGIAGVLFAVGNGIGAVVRIVFGLLADRLQGNFHRPIALLMLSGAMGTALLSLHGQDVDVVGVLIALGVGTGWSGLTFLLVMRSEVETPGASLMIVQIGGMLGSATGPAVMSLVNRAVGLSAAWICITASATAGAAVIATSRDRRRPARWKLHHA